MPPSSNLCSKGRELRLLASARLSPAGFPWSARMSWKSQGAYLGGAKRTQLRYMVLSLKPRAVTG